jgi:hypothetical protein
MIHTCGMAARLPFSIQEYLAASELAQDLNQKRLWLAIEEYFRSGWWEEVIVFVAGIKRDISPLINELHLHLVGPSGATPQLVRLVERMLAVADFTHLENVQPRGSVATAFAELEHGGSADYWRTLAQLSWR